MNPVFNMQNALGFIPIPFDCPQVESSSSSYIQTKELSKDESERLSLLICDNIKINQFNLASLLLDLKNHLKFQPNIPAFNQIDLKGSVVNYILDESKTHFSDIDIEFPIDFQSYTSPLQTLENLKIVIRNWTKSHNFIVVNLALINDPYYEFLILTLKGTKNVDIVFSKKILFEATCSTNSLRIDLTNLVESLGTDAQVKQPITIRTVHGYTLEESIQDVKEGTFSSPYASSLFEGFRAYCCLLTKGQTPKSLNIEYDFCQRFVQDYGYNQFLFIERSLRLFVPKHYCNHLKGELIYLLNFEDAIQRALDEIILPQEKSILQQNIASIISHYYLGIGVLDLREDGKAKNFLDSCRHFLYKEFAKCYSIKTVEIDTLKLSIIPVDSQGSCSLVTKKKSRTEKENFCKKFLPIFLEDKPFQNRYNSFCALFIPKRQVIDAPPSPSSSSSTPIAMTSPLHSGMTLNKLSKQIIESDTVKLKELKQFIYLILKQKEDKELAETVLTKAISTMMKNDFSQLITFFSHFLRQTNSSTDLLNLSFKILINEVCTLEKEHLQELLEILILAHTKVNLGFSEVVLKLSDTKLSVTTCQALFNLSQGYQIENRDLPEGFFLLIHEFIRHNLYNCDSSDHFVELFSILSLIKKNDHFVFDTYLLTHFDAALYQSHHAYFLSLPIYRLKQYFLIFTESILKDRLVTKETESCLLDMFKSITSTYTDLNECKQLTRELFDNAILDLFPTLKVEFDLFAKKESGLICELSELFPELVNLFNQIKNFEYSKISFEFIRDYLSMENCNKKDLLPQVINFFLKEKDQLIIKTNLNDENAKKNISNFITETILLMVCLTTDKLDSPKEQKSIKTSLKLLLDSLKNNHLTLNNFESIFQRLNELCYSHAIHKKLIDTCESEFHFEFSCLSIQICFLTDRFIEYKNSKDLDSLTVLFKKLKNYSKQYVQDALSSKINVLIQSKLIDKKIINLIAPYSSIKTSSFSFNQKNENSAILKVILEAKKLKSIDITSAICMLEDSYKIYPRSWAILNLCAEYLREFGAKLLANKESFDEAFKLIKESVILQERSRNMIQETQRTTLNINELSLLGHNESAIKLSLQSSYHSLAQILFDIGTTEIFINEITFLQNFTEQYPGSFELNNTYLNYILPRPDDKQLPFCNFHPNDLAKRKQVHHNLANAFFQKGYYQEAIYFFELDFSIDELNTYSDFKMLYEMYVEKKYWIKAQKVLDAYSKFYSLNFNTIEFETTKESVTLKRLICLNKFLTDNPSTVDKESAVTSVTQFITYYFHTQGEDWNEEFINKFIQFLKNYDNIIEDSSAVNDEFLNALKIMSYNLTYKLLEYSDYSSAFELFVLLQNRFKIDCLSTPLIPIPDCIYVRIFEGLLLETAMSKDIFNSVIQFHLILLKEKINSLQIIKDLFLNFLFSISKFENNDSLMILKFHSTLLDEKKTILTLGLNKVIQEEQYRELVKYHYDLLVCLAMNLQCPQTKQLYKYLREFITSSDQILTSDHSSYGLRVKIINQLFNTFDLVNDLVANLNSCQKIVNITQIFRQLSYVQNTILDWPQFDMLVRCKIVEYLSELMKELTPEFIKSTPQLKDAPALILRLFLTRKTVAEDWATAGPESIKLLTNLVKDSLALVKNDPNYSEQSKAFYNALVSIQRHKRSLEIT